MPQMLSFGAASARMLSPVDSSTSRSERQLLNFCRTTS